MDYVILSQIFLFVTCEIIDPPRDLLVGRSTVLDPDRGTYRSCRDPHTLTWFNCWLGDASGQNHSWKPSSNRFYDLFERKMSSFFRRHFLSSVRHTHNQTDVVGFVLTTSCSCSFDMQKKAQGGSREPTVGSTPVVVTEPCPTGRSRKSHSPLCSTSDRCLVTCLHSLYLYFHWP